LSVGTPDVACSEAAVTLLTFIIEAESSDLRRASATIKEVDSWNDSDVYVVPSAREFFDADLVHGPLASLSSPEKGSTTQLAKTASGRGPELQSGNTSAWYPRYALRQSTSKLASSIG
jgi:hypothetical protein